jgi:WD40 repeat protein
MHKYSLVILCGVALLLGLVGPATCAVTPLWIEHASVGGELSGVVISADGSTIIAGGDQLISLTPEGKKRWTGWSGTCFDISSDGDYILASRGQVVRLISASGTLLWDQSMDIAVKDLSLAPNASLIVATGGGKVRTMTFSGEAIASNATMVVNHLKILPPGDKVLITTNKNIQLSNYTLISEWSDTHSEQNLIGVAGDGSSFVTATYNRVRMYTGNGSLTWDKKFSGGNAETLAYSRDGSTIVIGKDDSTIMVLNHNGILLWEAHASNWITSTAVSDDGSTIAAGSMDKKVYVYTRGGTRLGTFTARSAIKFNSVAITGDGSLIVVVDESAVYGFKRSSFMPDETPEETINEPFPETTRETTATILPETTTHKVFTTLPTVPTPYPVESETTEAAIPLAIPLMALGLLLIGRFRNI